MHARYRAPLLVPARAGGAPARRRRGAGACPAQGPPPNRSGCVPSTHTASWRADGRPRGGADRKPERGRALPVRSSAAGSPALLERLFRAARPRRARWNRDLLEPARPSHGLVDRLLRHARSQAGLRARPMPLPGRRQPSGRRPLGNPQFAALTVESSADRTEGGGRRRRMASIQTMKRLEASCIQQEHRRSLDCVRVAPPTIAFMGDSGDRLSRNSALGCPRSINVERKAKKSRKFSASVCAMPY